MSWELMMIKPLLDLLYVVVGRSKNAKARTQAEAELREVVRDLLKESPNLTRAEFRIAVARALGITSEDLAQAERMLRQVRAHEARKRRVARTEKKPPRKKGEGQAAAK
jgi:2-hydroxychromene-2-carboxylate isomerase